MGSSRAVTSVVAGGLLLGVAGFALLVDGTDPQAARAPAEETAGTSAPRHAAAACDGATRLAGPDRVTSAVAVSRALWDASDQALVASARAFPDALAAAALASHRDAPILLTEPGSLPAAVAEELERLGVGTVTVLGGPAAVEDRVLEAIEDLAARPAVARIEGATRYHTAAALAEAAGRPGTGQVLLASGEGFPDALAGAAFAVGDDPVPTLLTGSRSLPEPTLAALARLDPDEVVVLGGTSVVSEAVVDDLRQLGYAPRRLAGRGRYETAAEVARAAQDRRGGVVTGVTVATGAGFADALSAGPAAARAGTLLALAPGRDLRDAPASAALLEELAAGTGCGWLVGGKAALGVRLAEQVGARIDALPPDGPPMIVGAGDIAWCPGNGDELTARLLDARPDATVVTFGDNAYEQGTPRQFAACYEPTWGRHRGRTFPTPGNHDYGTPGASGYFAYFGAVAGPAGRGWYAHELGPRWLAVALDSNCAVVDCGPDSDQVRWLRATLRAHPDHHVVAYFHHARYSSGRHGSDPRVAPLFQALYDHGVELALVGHEHDYERFARIAPDGSRDADRGVRQIVVGTGGANTRDFGPSTHPASEVRVAHTLGIIEVSLEPQAYAWRFVATDGRVLDRGRQATR